MQFTQEYVQKSTSTTLPRSLVSESGFEPGVLIHAPIPWEVGRRPVVLQVVGRVPGRERGLRVLLRGVEVA